jgi:hypothetical protein
MTLKKLDLSAIRARDVLIALFLDLAAFAFVFLTPKIGEFFHLPFYMVEPMRLMVILSIAHSNRINSYLLALTLPIFSWTVSGHPEFFKMLVMTGEITANVFLYYFLVRKINSVLLSMIISIVVSKIICYALYLVFFDMLLLQEEAEPVFLLAQVITTLIFSFYVALIQRKKFHTFAP